MTPRRRELIFGQQFANAEEHQLSALQSDELHPAESDADMPPGFVGEDDLIGRQRHAETVREQYERAGRSVSDDWELRRAVLFPQQRRRRDEVDQEWNQH